MTRANRQQYTVVVAMIDIDHFKKVNDTYGHAVGDVVIASVATLLRQRLRQTDIIGRYGGEEFLVVLPYCEAEDGWKKLENIREYFSRLRFRQGDIEFACTLSAGMVCSADVLDEERERLLVTADEALYRAKRGGRNQVCQ
ncbi:diguanylate cyclase [Vreelandella maris]|uniref:GGDEF domain-containing protein n=1 Tax=Vreelandella maris TaxID=2729617 RepID=UPI0030EC6AFB